VNEILSTPDVAAVKNFPVSGKPGITVKRSC
jgi:hypothetical protein